MHHAGIRSFLSGLAASASVAAGYVPIAFSFGLAAIQAGLSPTLGVFVSLLVYAGASQFLLISLLAAGAGVWTAVPTVWLMNARHLFYGPALQARLAGQPRRLASPWLAFGLTDEVFATAMSRLDKVPPSREHWLLGLQVGAYASWVGGTILGVMLADQAGDWPGPVQEALAFVLTALFFALMLETGIRRWRVPMLAGGIAAVLLSVFLPAYHALAFAIVVGAAAQAWHEGRTP